MKDEDVTKQILEAWDEVIAEEEGVEPEAAIAVEDAPEEPDADEPETEDEPAEEPEEEGDDEESDEEEAESEETAEEPPEPVHEFEDVEVQAYLGKYGGDVEKALKGAAEIQRLITRQGEEKNAAIQRAQELEAELAQARAFSGAAAYLTDEQQVWVEAAAESANPGVYVQQAIQAGEMELARAVCREWAQTNPLDATRASQVIDAVESQQSQQAAQPDPVPPETTWQALSTTYPELRTYEEQMVVTLQRLGPEHPLVQEARSTDPTVAVRGIFGIYEIAKASTFALRETHNGLKAKARKEADEAAEEAVVTSATAAPSVSQTPRQRRLMPGLTEEDLNAAFEAASVGQ